MKARHCVGQTPVREHEHVADCISEMTLAVLTDDRSLNAFRMHCGYLVPVKPQL